MNNFTIYANEYLRYDIQGYYNTYYIGYNKFGNPNYLNDLKNTFNTFTDAKLASAIQQLYHVLKTDLAQFDNNLTICVVPRAKAEKSYSDKQLLFKKIIQVLIEELGFSDGSNYIKRHTNTKTTHLAHSPKGAKYAGDGSMPYPGIIVDTCNILSDNVFGQDILLIDDIYTKGVNIDEDVIQALFDNGANSVIFYAVGKTV